MFDNIAPSYDLLNHVLSLGIDRIWRKKAISSIKAESPKQILDLATGTGDLAIEAAKQLSPDRIIGVDIAEKMLEIGRKKMRKKGLSDQIFLEAGDCEDLRFEEESFDAVISAFGVRNFENLDKGFHEMHRVLRKGGTLAILEFTRPRQFPFKQLFNLYFKNILPVIGRIKSKDPKAYQYLYESVQAFPDYDKLLERLEKIGFKSCKWKSLSLGICAIYLAKKGS